MFLVPHFTEVLLSSFFSVVFFLSRLFYLSRFVVSLVCQRSNFVVPLPLPFFSGAISRISGRDPLLVWESCDARRPTSQKIPEDSRCSGFPLCFFCACVIYFALHHVIRPSCHFLLHLNLNKLCGPSVHLNRGKDDFSL